MYKCLFCGLVNSSETAKFCSECGPNGPANDWTPEDIDQEAKVTQYVSMLSEFYFEAQNQLEVERHSFKMRERLKISHETHSKILLKFDEQKKAITHLSNFRFEFNENVVDAFAGHDTFLEFRYTNLSEEDSLKVRLFWDDPETTDRVDFRAETKGFVKPLGAVSIGNKAIFDRIGLKEISDLQLTVGDQFGDSANFRVEPFRFKVGNHDSRITQNISTHNQISIEGRGVVDASGMGAEKGFAHTSIGIEPRWKELTCIFIPETLPSSFFDKKIVSSFVDVTADQKNPDVVSYANNVSPPELAAQLPQLQKLALDGNANGQFQLGCYYAGYPPFERVNPTEIDLQKAVYWLERAKLHGEARASSLLKFIEERVERESRRKKLGIYDPPKSLNKRKKRN
jgi:hypothetical protein